METKQEIGDTFLISWFSLKRNFGQTAHHKPEQVQWETVTAVLYLQS